MKFVKALIIVLLMATSALAVGYYAPYGYRYVPQLTTQGTTDYAQIVASEVATDAWMNGVVAKSGEYKTLGDTNYATLSAAITTIGSTQTTLFVPAGAWVGGGVTVPANVTLQIQQGGYFTIANGTTLTIDGAIEAGPYQIFSWTGTGAIDLSSSPTAKVPVQWFGAVSGITNDCAAVITKMDSSLGPNQTMYFSRGNWRIASSVTLSGKNIGVQTGYTIEGDNNIQSLIYVNVGAGNDGITFTNPSYGWRIKNMGFVGPAGACKDGVVFAGGAAYHLSNVSFYMGCSGYGLKFGPTVCVYVDAEQIDMGHYDQQYDTSLTLVRCANGISMNVSSGDFRSVNLANTAGAGGNGIYMHEGALVRLNGSCEQWEYAINIDGNVDDVNDRPSNILVDNMYLIDGNTYGISANGVNHLSVQCTGLQAVGKTTIKNANYTNITGARITQLDIMPSCVGTALSNVGVDIINDYAKDTIYLTPIYPLQTAQTPFISPDMGPTNIISNAGLARWTATVPAGWIEAAGTSTISGVGEGDTTKHIANKCWKINTNGQASINPYYTLSAEELNQVKGQFVTFSMWIYIVDPGGGDAPTTYPIMYGDRILPNWTNGTAFGYGDGVRNATGADKYSFKVETPGTSGAGEPTWVTSIYKHTTDSTITWVNIGSESSNDFNAVTNMTSADIGHWRQRVIGIYVPANATSVSFSLRLYKGTSGDIDYYLAEPAIMCGGWTPRSLRLGQNESSSSVQVAANKMEWGSAPPGASTGWHQQGDVVWNTGAAAGGATASYWQCTVSGADAAATWVAHPLP